MENKMDKEACQSYEATLIKKVKRGCAAALAEAQDYWVQVLEGKQFDKFRRVLKFYNNIPNAELTERDDEIRNIAAVGNRYINHLLNRKLTIAEAKELFAAYAADNGFSKVALI